MKLYHHLNPNGSPKPNETIGTLEDVIQGIINKLHDLEGSFMLFRAFTIMLFLLMFAVWIETRSELHKIKEQITPVDTEVLRTDKGVDDLSWVGGSWDIEVTEAEPGSLLEEYSWDGEVIEHSHGSTKGQD